MPMPGVCKPLIGMIHLPPLPGSPGYRRRPYPYPHGSRYTMSDIVEYAVSEAAKYEDSGFDAVIVENYGDVPYKMRVGIAEAAALARIVAEVKRRTRLYVGVIVLMNDAYTAIVIAHIAGADFVRVNSLCETRVSMEGIIEPAAREAARAISELGLYDEVTRGEIDVLADVAVKHSSPLGIEKSLSSIVEDCASRTGFRIWGIVATGDRTGVPPSVGLLEQLRDAAGKHRLRVAVGSGIRAENVSVYWRLADAFIVGTSVKLGEKPENIVSSERASKLAEIVKRYRSVWACH